MEGCTGMLAALPAHSLTHLDLDLSGMYRLGDGSAVPAALARLTNLQRLRITFRAVPLHRRGSPTYSCLAGVAQLTRLTWLEVGNNWYGSEQLQQLLVQPLPLRLQRLKFAADVDEPGQLLLRLAQLPALQHLSLVFARWRRAAAAAAAWPQLPQLCELAVSTSGEAAGRQEWEAVLNGAAACSRLTKLSLGPALFGYEARQARIAPCAKLAGLTHLKDLAFQFCCWRPVPGDTLALTALTGLTRLVLCNAGAGWLRHLHLTGSSLFGMACLANVSRLTQLTQLSLCVNKGLTLQGLMLLTGLKRLQCLDVNIDAEVTKEMVKSFWAAQQQQQQL
ncbi:hypothetical protein COO60DRAFT_1644947 [Scenedesmus sp. NREL 46B-D3]|nr:hypothetical protein COO60DRAFT_1644947 [Scenedesmus sp. NREL 46B-D3]